MKKISKRIRTLRESIGLSQEELARTLKTTQSSINRYENGQTNIPLPLLRKYADFFDVSLDYIFGRTDKPQGMCYEFNPEYTPEKEELKRFVEMCFDPSSPMNEKLKKTLLNMMEGNEN